MCHSRMSGTFGLLEVCADCSHGLEDSVTRHWWKNLSCHSGDAPGKIMRTYLLTLLFYWVHYMLRSACIFFFLCVRERARVCVCVCVRACVCMHHILISAACILVFLHQSCHTIACWIYVQFNFR
jgi:hypothetical protein